CCRCVWRIKKCLQQDHVLGRYVGWQGFFDLFTNRYGYFYCTSGSGKEERSRSRVSVGQVLVEEGTDLVTGDLARETTPVEVEHVLRPRQFHELMFDPVFTEACGKASVVLHVEEQ